MPKRRGKSTTIINNPGGDSGMGTVITLVILLVLGYLFWVYAIPAMRNTQSNTPQINIPSEVDVNINQGE